MIKTDEEIKAYAEAFGEGYHKAAEDYKQIYEPIRNYAKFVLERVKLEIEDAEKMSWQKDDVMGVSDCIDIIDRYIRSVVDNGSI